MNTLQLDRVNVGSHPDEVVYFEYAKRFHECEFGMTDSNFTVYNKSNVLFSTRIELYESDHLTKTHRGVFEDGKRFRIVQPSDELLPLFQAIKKVTLTIGSMFSDGYAVTFLVEDGKKCAVKTEGLLGALIIGSNNPPKGQVTFHSNTHQRYEYGEPTRGEQIGCHRDVVIEKNISDGIGYSVTVNNPDAIPSSWGATPMGTKPMKVISSSNGKIELRGYGYDKFAVSMGVPMTDATFENYGISIFHNGKEITHCIVHLIERNVDIDYYIKP